MSGTWNLSPIGGCYPRTPASDVFIRSPKFCMLPSSVSPQKDAEYSCVRIGTSPPTMREPSMSPTRFIVTTGGMNQGFIRTVELNAPTQQVTEKQPVTFSMLSAQRALSDVILSTTEAPYMCCTEIVPVTFSEMSRQMA